MVPVADIALTYAESMYTGRIRDALAEAKLGVHVGKQYPSVPTIEGVGQPNERSDLLSKGSADVASHHGSRGVGEVSDTTIVNIDFASPSYHSPLISRDKILLVGANRDTVIPPDALHVMAKRWNVESRWHNSGHLGLLFNKKAYTEAEQFMLNKLQEEGVKTMRDKANGVTA
eukprot:TRINITY_DN3918_c0_g1_i2.p2 TRINITY_DN3918_c0_g1~~TRINITY_DN3918_c0_g1_i2.p2  ORF type:complete len:173 (-),score=32.39 TRINITY_DN3918_c0_g1_i2:87-605(-)